MGKKRRGEDGDDGGKKRQKPPARETEASKTAIVERMRRQRLERAVRRGREELRRYVPPKSAKPREIGWKLRGAARPWVEVEAAKTADHHDTPTDAISEHGQALCERLGAAREWRDALVELAKWRLANGVGSAPDLAAEALGVDAADARGAGLVAVEALQADPAVLAAWSSRHLAADRAMPRWTRLIAAWLAGDAIDPLVRDALDTNPYAPWCLAFPDAADAAIEYAEDLGTDFAPAGILEAIHVHATARRFFETRPPQDRAAIAALVSDRFAPSDADDEPEPPKETNPNAPMFLQMFRTARDMARDENPS